MLEHEAVIQEVLAAVPFSASIGAQHKAAAIALLYNQFGERLDQVIRLGLANGFSVEQQKEVIAAMIERVRHGGAQ